jgi:hypothetical protein
LKRAGVKRVRAERVGAITLLGCSQAGQSRKIA